ncbi:hypothetical protein [Streptomyces sp. enrichment culture]|uniref:hypothetical protein n=1 Tax=Streptomyces sp. enrichment culture TaxID=1795815 RepID=UPI003F5542DB
MLDGPVRTEILEGLCDIALSPAVSAEASSWDVTRTSLLRSIEPQAVESRFRRIARGGSWLMAYDFGHVTAPDVVAGAAVLLSHAAFIGLGEQWNSGWR